MRRHATIRFTAAACALLTTLLSAQTHRTRTRKPSASITTPAPQPMPQPVAPAPPPTPAELPAQPAQVTFSNGLLTVTAHNSSLNQILRDISRETSMKITGGVADERVFGNYGPEPPAQVLNSLLDGTSSNMMLVGSNGSTPAELVLTPRAGGVTPPSPVAVVANQNEQPEEPPSSEPYKGSAVENTPVSQPETTPAPASPMPAPASSPTPASDQQQQSPNGVPTPKDIYNQLMKLHQQQVQQHSNQQ